MHIGAATVELIQQIKTRTASWPGDSTSENISKETWNTITPMFIAALFKIAKIWITTGL